MLSKKEPLSFEAQLRKNCPALFKEWNFIEGHKDEEEEGTEDPKASKGGNPFAKKGKAKKAAPDFGDEESPEDSVPADPEEGGDEEEGGDVAPEVSDDEEGGDEVAPDMGGDEEGGEEDGPLVSLLKGKKSKDGSIFGGNALKPKLDMKSKPDMMGKSCGYMDDDAPADDAPPEGDAPPMGDDAPPEDAPMGDAPPMDSGPPKNDDGMSSFGGMPGVGGAKGDVKAKVLGVVQGMSDDELQEIWKVILRHQHKSLKGGL